MCNWKKILCCCAVAVMMTGCSTDSDKKEVVECPAVTETPEPTPEDVKKQEVEGADISMTAAYLKKGVFSENIPFGGSSNDTEQVLVKDGTFALPKGEIKTMVMGDAARDYRFIDATKEDVCKVLDILEHAEYQKDAITKHEKEIQQDKLNIETAFVYTNAKGEDLVLKLRTFGAGYHNLQVLVDDEDSTSQNEPILNEDTGKEEEIVTFYSEDLTQLLKDCMSWKEVTKEQFEEISSISVYNVSGQQIGEELSEEEITQLKELLDTAIDVSEEDICGTSYYLVCELQNGETISLGMSGDGCGFIATEGHMYKIEDEEDAKKSLDIMTKKLKTPEYDI